MEIVIGLVIGLLAGAAGGYFVRKSQAEKEVGSAEARAKTILESAGRDAEAAKREALIEAKDEIFQMRKDGEVELKGRAAEVERKEDRIADREATMDARASGLDRKEQGIEDKEAHLQRARTELEALAERAKSELERVAGMSAADARQGSSRRSKTMRSVRRWLSSATSRRRLERRPTAGPGRSLRSPCSGLLPS